MLAAFLRSVCVFSALRLAAMPSFKSKVASAFAWGLGLSPALAAVLPTRALELPRPDGKLLHYGTLHSTLYIPSPSRHL